MITVSRVEKTFAHYVEDENPSIRIHSEIDRIYTSPNLKLGELQQRSHFRIQNTLYSVFILWRPISWALQRNNCCTDHPTLLWIRDSYLRNRYSRQECEQHTGVCCDRAELWYIMVITYIEPREAYLNRSRRHEAVYGVFTKLTLDDWYM